MNKSFIAVLTILVLAGCSSNKPKVDTVRAEELSTDFVAEGIKVTSQGCGSMSRLVGRECVILSIESTSTAPSNGGSTVNRKNAVDAACAYALANVRHWMGERVSSNRIVERTANSTEKSSSNEVQDGTRDGAGATSNRSNANDTKTVVTNVVRRTANGYMEGWQPVNQEVVGGQEVSCTMRWNRNDTLLMKQARSLQ